MGIKKTPQNAARLTINYGKAGQSKAGGKPPAYFIC